MLLADKGNKKKSVAGVSAGNEACNKPYNAAVCNTGNEMESGVIQVSGRIRRLPTVQSSCLCLASCIKRRFLTHGAMTTQQREELQMAPTLGTKLLWATLIKVKSEHAVTQSGSSHQATAPSKRHFVPSLSARTPLGKTEIRQCKQPRVGKWQNRGAARVFSSGRR